MHIKSKLSKIPLTISTSALKPHSFKMNIKILALFLTFALIIEDSQGLFWGRRRSNNRNSRRTNNGNTRRGCYSDNQCSTGKCLRRDNFFCGIGSEYLLFHNFDREILQGVCWRLIFFSPYLQASICVQLWQD